MFETIAPTLAPESSAERQDLGGLLGIDGEKEVAFPLREVKVRAAIAGNCCRTVVEQAFDNPYEHPLEAVHIFPLPSDAAVTEFELRAGDTVVRGECREREEAERAFSEARAAGKRAGLLTAERADVHTIRVTNMPPGSSVHVRLVLVQRLDESDGAFDWRFPTVVAPRYLPGTPAGHIGSGAVPDTDRVPDASRLQPPLRLSGGTKLDLEVEIAGPLASLTSSLHAVRTTLGDTVRVAPAGRATLDRDFVLRFAPLASAASPIRAYSDGRFTLAIITPSAAPSARVQRDVVLLVDVSGSMEGQKLDAARRAVSAVLHGLEKGDRFRLIAFESSVHAQTPGFLPFDQASLDRADRWIRQLRSSGGTEMLPALKEAFAGDMPASRLRTIIFITDGQAANESELAALVGQHEASTLLFTVGIDTAVNESLLRRLARVGHGTCELLTPSDDIEEAVARIEARFGSPVVTNLVAVGCEAGRPQPARVFAGRPLALLLRGAPVELHLTANDAASHPIEFVTSPVAVSFPMGALWARERVAWLEDRIVLEPRREADSRKELLDVALEHHIASRFTAFVAIEERVSTDGKVVTVVQPAELPSTWSENFLCIGAPTVAAGMPSARDTASLLRAGGPVADVDAFRLLDAGPRAAAPHAAHRRGWLAERLEAFRAPLYREPNSGMAAIRDIETALATTQDADGSFGASVDRTAAALVTLLRLGHSRVKGTRRRVVAKCFDWLAHHATEAVARLALDLVLRVESGGELPRADEVARLTGVKPEGACLQRALELT